MPEKHKHDSGAFRCRSTRPRGGPRTAMTRLDLGLVADLRAKAGIPLTTPVKPAAREGAPRGTK